MPIMDRAAVQERYYEVLEREVLSYPGLDGAKALLALGGETRMTILELVSSITLLKAADEMEKKIGGVQVHPPIYVIVSDMMPPLVLVQEDGKEVVGALSADLDNAVSFPSKEEAFEATARASRRARAMFGRNVNFGAFPLAEVAQRTVEGIRFASGRAKERAVRAMYRMPEAEREHLFSVVEALAQGQKVSAIPTLAEAMAARH